MQWWPMLGLVGLFCILTNAEQRFLARALCVCTPTAQPHSNEQRTRPEGNEYTTKPTVYSQGQSQDTTNYSVILKLRGIDSKHISVFALMNQPPKLKLPKSVSVNLTTLCKQ